MAERASTILPTASAHNLPPKALLTIADIAQSWAVSEAWIRLLVRSGQLPSTRVAGRIVVPRPALEIWLQERSRDALESPKAAAPG